MKENKSLHDTILIANWRKKNTQANIAIMQKNKFSNYRKSVDRKTWVVFIELVKEGGRNIRRTIRIKPNTTQAKGVTRRDRIPNYIIRDELEIGSVSSKSIEDQYEMVWAFVKDV